MLIADTGLWVALGNRADRHHETAVERLREVAEPLITTWPVVTETCYLLSARLGASSQAAFLRNLATGAFELFELRPSHGPRLGALLEEYADLPMDLADASLVVLAEELGHGRILTTDQRDFHAYRWKEREPFENVLLNPPRV